MSQCIPIVCTLLGSWLCFSNLFSQEIISYEQPELIVKYGGTIRQDSAVKYFFTSKKSAHHTEQISFFGEFHLDSGHIHYDTLIDPTDSRWLFYSAHEMFVLPLPESDYLIVSNNFDCDVNATDVVCFEESGTIKWKRDPFDSYYDDVKAVGLAGPNIIALIYRFEPTKFLTFDGEDISIEPIPAIYYNTIKRKANWIGSSLNVLYKLDESFSILDIFHTDSIRYIKLAGVDKIIVGTNSSTILLDTNFNVLHLLNFGSTTAAASDSMFWIVSENTLYQLDHTFSVDTFFPGIPYEEIVSVHTDMDHAFVLSAYDGLWHKDPVLRKYSSDNSIGNEQIDIYLELIKLPEKIIREPWNGLYYAYTLHFDSISFIVRNLGQQPIRSFNFNYDWDTENWCGYERDEFVFDGFNIEPGELKEITIMDYTTGVIFYSLENPLCFWIDYPNRLPDINPSNNGLCEYANIISETENIPNYNIKLFPNPASDFIYFDSNGQTLYPLTAYIYDITGILLKNFRIDSYPTEFPVTEMPAGMYYIRLIDHENKADNRKLVISH